MHLPVGVVENPSGFREIDKVDVFPDELGNELTDVIHLGERLEQGNHLEEAAVVGVVVPRKDGHGVLVVEVVGVRRVVHNDDVFHVAAQQRQVLDVGALEAEAVLAVEAHGDELVLVERVDEGVRVDAHRRSVEHDLVDRRQLLEEEKDAWPNEDEDLDGSAFDDDPHLKITATASAARPKVGLRKLGVDERFVEVEHESLAAPELGSLWTDHCVLLWYGLLPKSTGFVQLDKLFLSKRQLPFDEHLSCLGCNRPRILLCLLLLLLRRRLSTLCVGVLNYGLVCLLPCLFGRTGRFTHSHIMLVVHCSITLPGGLIYII